MKETNGRKESYEKCVSLVSFKNYCEEMKEVLRVLDELKTSMEYYMNEGE